jgi:Na+/H+-dicarboxylate symporter
MSDSAATERPAEKKDRSHYLYMAVIAAVIAGIAVGILAPEVGKALKPLGTGFVSLIKMMISPVIFCTIVLGIGSIRQAAKVGKVGGLALLYFIVMSTVALIIGLLVVNSPTPPGPRVRRRPVVNTRPRPSSFSGSSRPRWSPRWSASSCCRRCSWRC